MLIPCQSIKPVKNFYAIFDPRLHILLHVFWKNDEFDTKIDKTFRITVFRQLGMDFYLSACYVASKKAFLFSVFLPSDKESAEPYNTKFIIEHPSIRRQIMVFEGQVLSIEEIDSILHPEVISKSWCVNYEAVKPFLKVKKEAKEE